VRACERSQTGDPHGHKDCLPDSGAWKAQRAIRYSLRRDGDGVKSGRTILTGRFLRSLHLHGILDRIGALGLKLVSVEDRFES
jgi:hypothetical protein